METVEHADSNTQALRDYMESRVLSARPIEIVEMLYQVAIDNLNAATRYLKTGEAMERATAVTKAEEAVTELMLALDHSVGASFTKTLAALYDYVLNQAIIGHAKKSEVAFQNAVAVLSTLLEGWAGVRAQVIESESRAAVPELSPFQPVPSQWTDYQQEVPAGSRDWSC
jgi:flagellar protein FliS